MANAAVELNKVGTSVWYDNISRDLLNNGALAQMIKDWGVRGLTSNPTIFDKAISSSSLYDAAINQAKSEKLSSDQIFEKLAIEDIAAAAKLLLPVYKESEGNDGFVSIEVSPLLAADTQGTISQARRLHKELNLENVMIKVPGTAEGIPAIRTLLEEGINVNVTLLFSVENYEVVAKTYVDALRARAAKGLPIDKIRSVASFFVSRVDSIIDSKLDEIAAKGNAKAASLKGKFGIANSQAAYASFLQIFSEQNFGDLRKKGGAVQRPLWASTGVKNPQYPDLMYVERLAGADTVNTMPHQTLEALVDHGSIKGATLQIGMKEALAMAAELIAIGVDVPALLKELQVDGVKKFVESFEALDKTIRSKM